jgi:formylglycine-generating enzyme required for sulfatase activity
MSYLVARLFGLAALAALLPAVVLLPGSQGRAPAPPKRPITNSLGMRLVWIKPGKFVIGSPREEKNRGTDEQQHKVEITRGFYLGAYEVTQGEYEKIMGTNPSRFCPAGGGRELVKGMSTSKFPVECVSYESAVQFCARLSTSAAEKREKRVYRLPSEAEWEYACRAGSSDPFAHGSSLSSTQANFDGNAPYGGAAKGPNLERTCQVGSYKPNAWGLFDMHGNVSEWCSDWYADWFVDAYGHPTKINPKGPAKGLWRVIRGGGYNGKGMLCRAAIRGRFQPADRYDWLGFRVACDLSGK